MMDVTGDTAAKMFLACERKHAREAVIERRDGERVERTPDWRFDRQVLRLAIYLRERAGVRAGDRVATVAPLGAEALVVEWASLVQGVLVGTIDGDLADDVLHPAIATLAPRVVFAADARVAKALGAIAGVERVIVLSGDAGDDASVAYAAALDLGGTLDTAERAQALRAEARALATDSAALAWLAGSNGAAEWRHLTQGEVAKRVRRSWLAAPPTAGATRIVGPVAPSLDARIALVAGVADGRTTILFGAPAPSAPIARRGWLARLVRPSIFDRGETP